MADAPPDALAAVPSSHADLQGVVGAPDPVRVDTTRLTDAFVGKHVRDARTQRRQARRAVLRIVGLAHAADATDIVIVHDERGGGRHVARSVDDVHSTSLASH